MASRLERFGGLWYLLLEGDAVTRGREHARLTKEIVGTKTADYYARLLSSILRQQAPRWLLQACHSPLAALLAGLFGIAQLGIDQGSLADEVEAFLAEQQRGGARQLIRFPDLLHWLAGMAGGHCSAVFLENGAHSRLARNFDFYGPHVWGRYRALKLSFPPSGQPWLWAGPLGIPVGGFGINAAGIAVMPFTNFSRDLALRGVPLFTLLQTILEKAGSLEEALYYLENTRRHGGFSFLLADMRRGKALAVAVGARCLLIDHPRDGVLVRTNHHHELDKPPAPGMGIWQRHSRSRWQRLDQLARALPAAGGSDPLLLRTLLADRTSYTGKRSLFTDVTGSLNVATSVILEGMTLYVADAGFPACDALRWHAFSLDECFSGRIPSVRSYDVPDHLSAAERAAVELTVEGWTRFFDEGDAASAGELWSQAHELIPQEAALFRMLAMAAYELGEKAACQKFLRTLLELEPGDEVARLALRFPKRVYLECMAGQLALRH